MEAIIHLELLPVKIRLPDILSQYTSGPRQSWGVTTPGIGQILNFSAGELFQESYAARALALPTATKQSGPCAAAAAGRCSPS